MATYTYKNLKVWQRSMDLVEDVYSKVKELPLEEKYALADQLRRSVVSIPSNIAEGQKRNSKKEFVHFCSIAKGSLAELETQLEIARRVYAVNISETIAECDEIGRMLTSLVKSQVAHG